METLLNAVWLAMAAVALCHWRGRAARKASGRGGAMLALACALLLLFPVISISDDLHADVFTEDLPTKRVVQNAAHLTHPSAIASPVLSLPGPVVSSRVPCEIPAAGSPCRPVYRAALRAPPLAGSC